MTLIELLERLLPYFPQLPPEVAEFFGEILLTGDPGKVDTYDLLVIMHALPFPPQEGRHDYQYAAIRLLDAIRAQPYEKSRFLKFAKEYLDQLSP